MVVLGAAAVSYARGTPVGADRDLEGAHFGGHALNLRPGFGFEVCGLKFRFRISRFEGFRISGSRCGVQ